jgi:hypothetical protein
MANYVNQLGTKVSEVGTKTLALATEVAEKGIDFTAQQISILNNYDPLGTNEHHSPDQDREPELEWEDWRAENGQEIQENPASNINPVSNMPKKNSAVDEWEDF